MEQKEKYKIQLEQIVSQKNKNNVYLYQHQYGKVLLKVKAAKLKETNKSDVDRFSFYYTLLLFSVWEALSYKSLLQEFVL